MTKKKRTITKKSTRKRAVNQAAPPAPTSKKDAVIALLNRPGGATLTELMTATGWQAHSVRGFISGTMRKKLSLSVCATRNQVGQQTYRITTQTPN